MLGQRPYLSKIVYAHKYIWLILAYVLCSVSVQAQNFDDKAPALTPNGIDKLHVASTHPFGIFSSRISQNFQQAPVQDITVRLQQQSGNVFQPRLKAFLPENQNIRDAFSDTPWFLRVFDFVNQEETPAQIFDFELDAILKVYRLDVRIPIAKRHELHVGTRFFTAVRGSNPWSFFSSDETIEWFHSNIAGGEDAFGRRFYGLNKVRFTYTDAQGRSLQLKRGEFFLGGIEVSHFYYPEIPWATKNNISINTGVTAGWNTTRFNNSLDIGLQLNVLKSWYFKNKQSLSAGLGISTLRRNLIDFKENVSLGNNNYLGAAEVAVAWTLPTKQGNYNSLAILYQHQTSYRKKEEQDYFHLKGNWQDINAGWHHAFTTLVEDLSSWSLMYTHGRKKIQYHVYFKEDLSVNNAPDVESGIGVTFKL